MSALNKRVLTLYHFSLARSTRCLWLFYELEAIYGQTRMDFPELVVKKLDKNTFRTEKSDEFLKLNPNGKVPVLVDGDIVMWDSCAICYYLLDMYDFDGVLLRRGDPHFLAKFHQLSFYASGTLDTLSAYSSPIQRVEDETMPGKRQEVVEKNRKFFFRVAGPMLLKELGDRKFFSGHSFTALDVIVGYSVRQFFSKDLVDAEQDPDYAILKEFSIRMGERPALRRALEN